jgi:hypothetical protein
MQEQEQRTLSRRVLTSHAVAAAAAAALAPQYAGKPFFVLFDKPKP